MTVGNDYYKLSIRYNTIDKVKTSHIYRFFFISQEFNTKRFSLLAISKKHSNSIIVYEYF